MIFITTDSYFLNYYGMLYMMMKTMSELELDIILTELIKRKTTL